MRTPFATRVPSRSARQVPDSSRLWCTEFVSRDCTNLRVQRLNRNRSNRLSARPTTGRMTDTRPMLVIPKSINVAHMFDSELIDTMHCSDRAQRNGIVIIMPRDTRPSALMATCYLWPNALREAGVTRVALVLGVAAYGVAEPLLRGCARQMSGLGITITYFHEGHLESDQIRAWFERRKSNQQVSPRTMIELGDRYAQRGDIRGAVHAVKIAEQLAA